MAEQTEKIFIIPLRKECLKCAKYERTKRAVRTIKRYVARHMKIPEHDVSKVKLDVYFNNAIWARGKTKPPVKIKVKAFQDGEFVRVDFVEIPEKVKFAKARHEKIHAKSEEPKKKTGEKPEEKQTEEEKKEESEKSQAAAEQKEKQAKADAKALKHTRKETKVPTHRTTLSRH